ncbi:hypothetical protein [Bacillus sp. FJAT-50079]|uniref:hypothetical protein n=1 Tax=Bacillus sp. FJAT-50079 TaxID=2833577 RepID=UPI001BCA18C1|nr:hypothetical protein [Bacillus sp. FJAT-50079]MBS4208642.1 hypothetical protein [Bacillus sp. FJAT-50079]
MTKFTDHELEEWFSEFSVEYPDEEKVEDTMIVLHQFVPKKKTAPYTKLIPAPLKNAWIESLQFSHSFWISNLLYLALGLCLVFLVNGDPYITLLFVAPLPILVGLIEIFRSRDEGLIELELSCTFSPTHIILSKLMVVGFFNLACTLFLISVFHYWAEPIVLIKLLQFWAVPYSVTIAISLFLSLKFKAMFAIPITIFILVLFELFIVKIKNIDLLLPSGLAITIVCCALIGIGLSIKMIQKGVYHEFNH